MTTGLRWKTVNGKHVYEGMVAATCHPARPHKAQGLCVACYMRKLYHASDRYKKAKRRIRSEQVRPEKGEIIHFPRFEGKKNLSADWMILTNKEKNSLEACLRRRGLHRHEFYRMGGARAA